MAEIDPHRLPRWITPRRYALTLTPDLGDATFTATVSIEATVVESTDVIVMNAHHLGIDSVAIDGSVVVGHDLDEELQRLTIRLAHPVEVGDVHIDIAYHGVLGDQLVGFYRSTYDDDEGTHTIACTQFEAPFAREALPCWDEPDRKAVFAVTLVVPDDLLAVSNSAEIGRTPAGDGTVAVRFADTIPMSTYLLAFVVGRLVATDPIDVRGVPVRVICRPGREHLAATALDVARHSIEWFEDYYAIPYPGDKMDLVALPDFAFGAMENLGCITFREILLLGDPAEMAQAEVERLALVVAHEIAHMWFGDLVTMGWWEGIWLNEAFATFMETACVDAYRPEWDEWTRFGLARAEAFQTDSLAATRPIEYVVETPADAEGMFDVLTYEKGGAVLRMMEQYLGPETFRDGVRRYLAAHAYGNTVTADLWSALEEASGQPVGDILDTWILQGGHPIVEVTATDDGISLGQQRMGFVGGDPAPARTWSVPVTVRDATGARRTALVGAEPVAMEVPPGLVQANAGGVGFYRTAYPPELATELTSDAGTLPPLERFMLLDDTWALVGAARVSLADMVAVCDVLSPDTETSVWKAMAGIVGTIRRIGGANAADATASWARRLTAAHLGSIDRIDPELAGIVWRLAGGIGADATVIERSRAWVDRPDGVDPELLAAAIDVTATHGDHATYERFVDAYRTAPTPQEERRYLEALARFRDPAAFADFLELTATEIRTQDAPYQLAVAMGNAVNGAIAWSFTATRWDALVERFPSNSIVRMAGGIRSLFEPEVTASVLEFFATHDIPQGAATLTQHLELVRVHRSMVERLRSEVVGAVGGR